MKTTAKHAVPALLSVLLMPAAAQVHAQAATLTDCQAIQDRLARYACYDSWDSTSGEVRPLPRSTAPQPQPARTERAAPQAATTAPAASAAPPAGPATAIESSVADFGRQQSSTRVVEGEDGAELVGTVAALEQLGPNLWVVTLEGGQRWRQMLTKRYALQVGDDVRIYSTRWGSAYRLSSERVGGYIQVERVDAGAVADAPMPGPRVSDEAEDDKPSLLSRILRRDGTDDDAATAAPAPQAVATAGSAPASVDDFGREQARIVQADDGKDELIDTVAALQQLGPNLWIITLESGQRWQQMLSKRYALQAGDEVRIYPTRWGSSFRLSVERLGGYIQVERID